MTKQEKMLNLILSDKELADYYDLDISNIYSMTDALNSDQPIIVAIAKIIKGINGSSKSSKINETYKEVFNYLNTELI